MKVAIMQPYFMPYIGYFQLINAVDVFVVYDNIEYTKKGWINRNRILVNGKDEFITLPLKKDSDYLHINQRNLADSFEVDKHRILRKIKECYLKAPNFKQTFVLIEEIFSFDCTNLFEFILNSIKIICKHLDIKTELFISSTININHDLKSEQKVLAICKSFNADCYINSFGGIELYSKEVFFKENIELKFLSKSEYSYSQIGPKFVPNLSILDVLMFVDSLAVQNHLTKITLI